MLEQIEQLESHIERLLRTLESERARSRELQAENERLRQQEDEAGGVRQQNDQLATQVQQLEGELEGMTNKESQVRERLRGILERIDTIEREIKQPEAHH